MRAAIIALMLMIGSPAGAVQAIECKPGKKYLGIFVSAESPIPLPRFILDEERGWFYADEESSWRNWSNELTKTHGKGIYYLEIKKFGSKTYRKTAEMVFDRFSGEFTLTVYEEKRYLEYAWVKGANLYLLNGFCEKLARKF